MLPRMAPITQGLRDPSVLAKRTCEKQVCCLCHSVQFTFWEYFKQIAQKKIQLFKSYFGWNIPTFQWCSKLMFLKNNQFRVYRDGSAVKRICSFRRSEFHSQHHYQVAVTPPVSSLTPTPGTLTPTFGP